MNESSSSNAFQTDWARVDALCDEDVDFSDILEVTSEMFGRAAARGGLRPVQPKKGGAMRRDADVLDWFKAQARGCQKRINLLLRAYMGVRGDSPSRGRHGCN